MQVWPFQVMAELSITFLGTGTSQGVPFVACDCVVCQSTDSRDKRLRSSILVEAQDVAFLVDTTPDFRAQALRHNLRHLDAAIFTHSHTDHVAGFDDLRRFCELADRPMPVYASPQTMADLRRVFHYAFDGQHSFRNYVRPEPHEVTAPFEIGSVEIIPPDVIAQILGIPVLIIDALRHKSHPSHLSLSEALEVATITSAGRAYLTHIGHDLGHEETEKLLPSHVRLAHDGLRIEI
jgi:phosphoribosyl 1,2-cyclic phosphate phosphodiesterase